MRTPTYQPAAVRGPSWTLRAASGRGCDEQSRRARQRPPPLEAEVAEFGDAQEPRR
jgi:hypothetical protein